ncbi:RxLR effector protein [Phytophthora megakarya]|uniref:RxLR effector protein n=1 Tax=Phytophthora megakarya TaxID=4795 RepID=A0A225UIT4_9STRA|nr:RxLR effector protein [Phytophthora megakarya]
MRSFSLIFAAVAVAVLATCTANSDSDQSKILTVKSSDLVHPVDIGHKYDGTVRLLRGHRQNEELEMEERMFDGRSVRKAARSILNIDDLSAKNAQAKKSMRSGLRSSNTSTQSAGIWKSERGRSTTRSGTVTWRTSVTRLPVCDSTLDEALIHSFVAETLISTI